MSIRFTLSLALITTLVLAPVASRAQITAPEADCRDTISKYMGKYVKAVQKSVQACHRKRNQGIAPSSEPCNDPLMADLWNNNKAAAALANAFGAIFTACSGTPGVIAAYLRCPAPHETADDAIGGSGIDDVTELADCLARHTRTVLGNTSARVLGSPLLPLTKSGEKCHQAIAKSVAKVVDTTAKVRTKCQKALDDGGGPIDFACATADPSGKIATAIAKGEAKIQAVCSALTDLERANLDSCAVDAANINLCALEDAAKKAGAGTAAVQWELDGSCPAQGSYVVESATLATEVDTGSPGIVHDMDPVLGFGGLRFDLACDGDCASCTATGIAPPDDACRCNGDASVICSVDGDCAGFGGDCRCFYGPPAPYSAGGTPACVQTEIYGPMGGDFQPGTGDLSVTIPVNVRIYIGISQLEPCPVCDAGVCSDGARAGLGCSVDASDATFGDVSYDCPPSLASNISGAGVETTFDFSTGMLSMPMALPCDSFFSAFDCACSTCSLDNTIACNSDAECATASAGVCRTDGLHGGSLRSPNACDDLVCSPDDPLDGPNEGYCAGGPVDSYCDGFVRSNGDGVLACVSNLDCDALDPACPNGDCGTCSITSFRDCFLDPIVASGTPGQMLVGEGCIAPSTNGAVNSVCGWPGPYRIRQQIAPTLFCADGVTPFDPPGGSGCP
jgi:hypothetical protein